MKKVLLLAVTLVFAGAGVAQAAETWKGTIGDSMCGMKHEAGKHGDKAGDHKSCVEKCVAGGGEYVFLTKEKAIPIANQSFAALKEHATGARKRGECFFAALVDPEGKAALAPLYNDKKS